MSGIALDQTADARNMHVDGALNTIEGLALDTIDKSFPRQDLAGMLGQGQKQCKLMTGKRTRLPAEAHFTRTTVDLELSEPKDAPLAAASPASQDSAQPG